MAKAIVMCFEDGDPGATANDVTVYAQVLFSGTEIEIPGRVVIERRVALPIVFTNVANYPNVVEDALILRASQLVPPVTLARTDCLFPSYARGA